MQKQVLVGVAGKAGSGKDTVGNFLKEHYPFRSVAFADPIRAGMRAILGLTDKHFSHPDKEVVLPEFGKSPRQMMQSLGTEWARECVNQDLWLILAGKKIDEYNASGYDVVITDVRFENEAAFIRNQGGVIWHVKRGNGTAVAHASEAGIAYAVGDSVIENYGTLDQLHSKVDAMLTEIYGWQEAADV